MQFDFALPGNGSQRIEATGRFIKYASGKGLIRVKTSTGQFVDLLPGQGVNGVAFSGLTISDRSGAGNAGVLLAGDFQFSDDTITGTIGTYDDTARLTYAGSAFIGQHGHTGGSNDYGFAALVNPVASGITAVVTSLRVYVNRDENGAVSGAAGARGVTVYLAPIVGAPANGGGFRNKKGGVLTLSKAFRTTGTAGGSPIGAYLSTNGVPASEVNPLFFAPVENYNRMENLALREPITVPQGYALYWTANNPYGGASAMFEFREDVA